MRFARLAALATLSLTLLAASRPPRAAGGHPQVFVEYAATVRVGQEGPEAVEVDWRLDSLFSRFLLQFYDRNRDGDLSADELRAMEEDQRAQLGVVHYFLELWVNEHAVPVVEVRDFQVRPGERLGFRFLVPVPPSAADGVIEIAIQDPTAYMSFAPRAQSPVRAEAPSQYAVECDQHRTASGSRRYGLSVDILRCAYKRLP
jgi:ABC-type uncharacterized transport system substrate-binding protein